MKLPIQYDRQYFSIHFQLRYLFGPRVQTTTSPHCFMDVILLNFHCDFELISMKIIHCFECASGELESRYFNYHTDSDLKFKFYFVIILIMRMLGYTENKCSRDVEINISFTAIAA